MVVSGVFFYDGVRERVSIPCHKPKTNTRITALGIFACNTLPTYMCVYVQSIDFCRGCRHCQRQKRPHRYGRGPLADVVI